MADTLRIRMMTMASGPDWQALPGQEIELPRRTAEDLLSGGYAQRLTIEEPEPASAPDAEAAGHAEAPPPAGPTAGPATTEARPDPAPPETATAPPQRSPDADEAVAAEAAGRKAALAGEPRTANPNDGRSAPGKAWFRGWDSARR
jgi:hypothetical protein